MEISILNLVLIIIGVFFLTLMFSTQIKRILIKYIPPLSAVLGHEFVVAPSS